MPLNVRRFYTSALLVLVSFTAVALAQTTQPAQSPAPQTVTPATVPANPPTAGEIMRERISRAKAFIAVRNYNAAIYELENIRRETADASVQGVVSVLLMNSYLEQSDYKRAKDFLNEAYNQQKTTKANATANYLTIASQVVKSARNRVERYRALGLNVSDRTLPLEAVTDLEKMRETLEIVITQSKDVGKDKAKTADAMALLEEAANSRSMLARDEYDARHWKDEVADTREQVATSRSIVVNAVNDGAPDTPVMQNQVAVNIPPTTQPSQQTNITPSSDNKIVFQPVTADTNSTNRMTKTTDSVGSPVQKTVMQAQVTPVSHNAEDKTVNTAKPDNSVRPRTLIVSNPQPKTADNTEKANASGPAAETVKDPGPLDVGSLLAFATRQSPPVYPLAAKNMRATGMVRVEVTVDENGDVAEVQKASGPALLQGAAKDAIRKWRFRPFVRDGQPVKAIGFVTFNFSL